MPGNTEGRSTLLKKAADKFGTPSYVYFADDIRRQAREVAGAFKGSFVTSYAVKANPNLQVLAILQEEGLELDVSSIGEFRRGVSAGFDPAKISFTGPAKKACDIREAIERGIGYIVCESMQQLETVNHCARALGIKQDVLVRLNPMTVPRGFGLQMGGRPSQFGVDEEVFEELYPRIAELPGICLKGLHVFSGGNSLYADIVIENFSLLADIFSRLCSALDIVPQRLVFGSGFGIPYFQGDKVLDFSAASAAISLLASNLTSSSRFSQTQLVLEMGRFLVGSHGYLLTSVVDRKHSRGTDICVCDAGFNNHLNAAGMMGAVMRRDWPFFNVSRTGIPVDREYQLVGPLCASFDVLANKANLPDTRVGDVLAVGSSGAYGFSASPMHFISHPAPRELLVELSDGKEQIRDISEAAYA